MKDWNIEDTSTIDAWERASDVYAEQVTGEVRALWVVSYEKEIFGKILSCHD